MTDITLYKQIHPKQCALLATMGFKTLINLRFDDECPNQPKNSDIATQANHLGLTYHHLPYDDKPNRSTIQTFAQLINTAPKPILVFCGSGLRAKRLYQSAKILDLLTEIT